MVNTINTYLLVDSDVAKDGIFAHNDVQVGHTLVEKRDVLLYRIPFFHRYDEVSKCLWVRVKGVDDFWRGNHKVVAGVNKRFDQERVEYHYTLILKQS